MEFRQLTERSLRENKIGALRAAALSLDTIDVVLSPADARHWSQAEDVESYLALVYNFTTWLQESLVQAMLQSMESRG
jgi:uncharacterized membrane protein